MGSRQRENYPRVGHSILTLGLANPSCQREKYPRVGLSILTVGLAFPYEKRIQKSDNPRKIREWYSKYTEKLDNEANQIYSGLSSKDKGIVDEILEDEKKAEN